MLSYADLERALRAERESPALSKLSREFYAQVKELAASPEAGEYSENVREYLEKIYCQRVNKIIHYAGRAAANQKPPENILPQEERLYSAILSIISENRSSILDKEPERNETRQVRMRKVRLMQAMPAIIASDSEEYGPFKVDDVVSLPQDTANLLIERKAAESFDS